MRIIWPLRPLFPALPLALMLGLGSMGCGGDAAKCGNLKVEKGEACDDGTRPDFYPLMRFIN